MRRWANPLIVDSSAFDDVWSRESDFPLLVVVGKGFDPRVTVSVRRLLAATSRRLDLLFLELPVESTDPSVRPLVDYNLATLTSAVLGAGGTIEYLPLPKHTDSGSLGRLVSRAFQGGGYLERYDEMVVEISAMPRSIYFPLIRGILERAHSDPQEAVHWAGELHIAVCEHPAIDALVVEEGTRPMAPVGGFGGSTKHGSNTIIWVPIVGENAGARMRRLYTELGPHEVCPVLPWPSRYPRRSDELLVEHRDLLFQTIRLEPRNVIHASEVNPFDLYRTIAELNERYVQALSPIGSVQMVLSSHSSKLLSIGVLLAAYDFKLEVQHVSPSSYGVRGDPITLLEGAEVFDLWLTGLPYRGAT